MRALRTGEDRVGSWWPSATMAWRQALVVCAASLVLLGAAARADDGAAAAAFALQGAVVSPEDLPLDAEGRSALDGRAIAGVVPRNVAPEGLAREQEALEAQRAEIAAGQLADDAAVRVAPAADGLPARVDSGDPDPDRQLTVLPLPAAR
jgi:hypothetical protein